MSKNISIGIVASAGGLNTLSTLGIIQFIKEHNIRITACAGSSGGSFPLAAFCAGIDLRTLNSERIAKELSESFFDPDRKGLAISIFNFLAYVIGIKIKDPLMGIRAMGYFKGDGLFQLLKEKFGNLTFRDTLIPLYVPAWNITEKQTDLFHRDGLNPTLAEAIRMTSSIPLVFRPYNYNNCLYWDGGITSSLPVKELLEQQPGISFVILVDTVSGNDLVMDPLKKSMSLLHALNDIVVGVQNTQIQESIDYAVNKLGEDNVLILTPPHRYGWSDFSQIPEIVADGYQLTKNAFRYKKQLQRMIEIKS